MKSNITKIILPVMIGGLALGTAAALPNTTGFRAGTLNTTSGAVVSASADETGTSSEVQAATVSSKLYSEQDLKQTADLSAAKKLTVTSGQDLEITQAGVYVLSGTAQNTTVRVNVPNGSVQLVLDGLSITNKDVPAIYVESAGSFFVTTASGSKNTLTVTEAFQTDAASEVEIESVIFAQSDIVLNGLGTLTINSSKNGVTATGDLKATGGTYVVTAKDGGALEAHERISIADGTFTLDAEEGFEGTYITIDGGTFDINSSGDGINATEKNTKTNLDVVIEVNGGDIKIKMAEGDTDALDANGKIIINGGNLDITAQSAFDYDISGVLNGGTVTVNGNKVTDISSQMMGGGFTKPDRAAAGSGANGSTDTEASTEPGARVRGDGARGFKNRPDAASGATENTDRPSRPNFDPENCDGSGLAGRPERQKTAAADPQGQTA